MRRDSTEVERWTADDYKWFYQSINQSNQSKPQLWQSFFQLKNVQEKKTVIAKLDLIQTRQFYSMFQELWIQVVRYLDLICNWLRCQYYYRCLTLNFCFQMLPQVERGWPGGNDKWPRCVPTQPRPSCQFHPGLQRTTLSSTCFGCQTGIWGGYTLPTNPTRNRFLTWLPPWSFWC